MALFIECPLCHRKQSLKNEKCTVKTCESDLKKARKNNLANYWLYQKRNGVQAWENVGRLLTVAREREMKARVDKTRRKYGFMENERKERVDKGGFEMEKPLHQIHQITDKVPTNLYSAKQIAQKMDGLIEEQRLIELADSGYVPHYRIDKGSPRFALRETQEWLHKNLVARCQGKELPFGIKVVYAAPDIEKKPPLSILNVPHLQQVPIKNYQPGVYFLCKEDEVVYVGQSVNPGSRISNHAVDDEKDFDRAYLLPIPKSDLNDVEAAFIQHLRPPPQGGIRQGKENPTSPCPSRPVNDILNGVYLRNNERSSVLTLVKQ